MREKPKFLSDSDSKGMITQKKRSCADNLLYTNHKREMSQEFRVKFQTGFRFVGSG